MNDKLTLPKGYVYAYFTLYPNQDVFCYTSSKSNRIEQASLGLSGAFSVYDPDTKKRVGSTSDGLIYTFWLNDASEKDIEILEQEYPVVVMSTVDGQIFTEMTDVPGYTVDGATSQSAEITV